MFTDTEKKIILLRKNILNITGVQHRKHNLHLTKNSGVFLHCVLTSIRYENDKFIFSPSDENKEILNWFSQYDLVDTYSKLNIDPGFYPPDYVKKANDYVSRKARILCQKKINDKWYINAKNKRI